MKKLLIFLAAFALLASCQTQDTEITVEEQQEIVDILKAQFQFGIDSMAQNTKENFESFLQQWVETDDKAWVGEPAFWFNLMYLYPDKEAIMKSWDPSRISRQSTNMKIEEDYYAVISKECALHVYKGTFSITDKEGVTGPDIPMSGTSVMVLRDGEWKLLHRHLSWDVN